MSSNVAYTFCLQALEERRGATRTPEERSTRSWMGDSTGRQDHGIQGDGGSATELSTYLRTAAALVSPKKSWGSTKRFSRELRVKEKVPEVT